MRIRLNNEDFEFLKKNAEDVIPFINPETYFEDSISFLVSDYTNFMDELNFAIIENGMDDEDTVNEIGKKLYNIYDKILDQKARNQNEN